MRQLLGRIDQIELENVYFSCSEIPVCCHLLCTACSGFNSRLKKFQAGQQYKVKLLRQFYLSIKSNAFFLSKATSLCPGSLISFLSTAVHLTNVVKTNALANFLKIEIVSIAIRFLKHQYQTLRNVERS